jgi:hypothetical protein
MDEPVRFTLPADVAKHVDLDAIERHARLIEDSPIAYRTETMAGVEMACSRAIVAMIVGALSEPTAGSAAPSPTCAETLQKLIALLTERAPQPS